MGHVHQPVTEQQLHFNGRVARQKVGDQPGQHLLPPRAGRGDANLAAELLAQVAQLLVGMHQRRQRLACEGEVNLACRRQGNPPRAARKQGGSHRLLKLRHALADHALADAHVRRSGADAQVFSHLDEGAQHVGGKGHCLPFENNPFALQQVRGGPSIRRLSGQRDERIEC